jgi:mevalonate pyrophosphate decarboxylase
MKGVEDWLSRLSGNKQYFYLAHPAYPSEESLLMYAADTPKGKIRQERGMEYKAVTSPRWERWLAQFDLQPVRYSEADKQGRQNLKKILVG